ncbi:MAG: ABC transporter permease [Acidimicrobiia bacterium]|nr:ABC transporter permease [Acidimicrobiia bacterium]
MSAPTTEFISSPPQDRIGDRFRRARRTALGFLRMGYLRSVAYPLGFVLEQVHALVFPIIFVFIADLTGSGGSTERFGGDYYTFVIIGIFSIHAITAGIRGFSAELDQAILHGNFEMLLVEPIRWRMLPFGMSLWPMILGLLTGAFILFSGGLLGAQYDLGSLPTAFPIVLLGLTAGLSLSILSASVKVLAKKGDPVLTVFLLIAQVFSGAYFTLDMLPAWIRWLAYLIPHTYVIGALRRILMPGGDMLQGMTLNSALLGLAIFNVIMYPLALYLFGRGMEVGRRYGLLGGY